MCHSLPAYILHSEPVENSRRSDQALASKLGNLRRRVHGGYVLKYGAYSAAPRDKLFTGSELVLLCGNTLTSV